MDTTLDIYDKIPEHLQCPICMDVPKNKVFQCRKGHYMCEECYHKLRICPQCRIHFDSEGIRNLHVEMMLDKYNWDCPYNSSGCKTKLSRKLNRDHIQTCFYNVQRFGDFVSVCQGIGLGNCSFKVNRGNVTQFIQHLKFLHGASAEDLNSLEIEFADYVNFSGGTKPIILNMKKEGRSFLVLVTHKPSGLSWAAYYLERQRSSSKSVNAAVREFDFPRLSYKVECSLRGQPLTWAVFPVNVLSSDFSEEHFHWSLSDISASNARNGWSAGSLFAVVELKKVDRNDVNATNRSTFILCPNSLAYVCQTWSILTHGKGDQEDIVRTFASSVPGPSLTAGENNCSNAITPELERTRIFFEQLQNLCVLHCLYRKYGCHKLLTLKLLEDHVTCCYFNLEKFGVLKNLCKAIRLGKCSFKMNRGNVAESIRHFETVHEATIVFGNSLKVEFTDFAQFSSVVKPFIFNRAKDGYVLMILLTPNAGSLHWATYYISYPKPGYTGLEMDFPSNPFQVECSINGPYKLTWMASPVDIFIPWAVKSIRKNSHRMAMFPSMRYGSALENVLAQVKVIRKQERLGQVKLDDASLILTPFSMPNLKAATGSNFEDGTVA